MLYVIVMTDCKLLSTPRKKNDSLVNFILQRDSLQIEAPYIDRTVIIGTASRDHRFEKKSVVMCYSGV